MSQTYYPLTPREAPGLLSLVIPLYNEYEMVPLLVARLNEFLDGLSCPTEVILVNDGSADRTMERLREVASSDPRFKVVGLARNFGHQLAATAGMDAAAGDAVVLMDADLQDPPELVHDMIREYQKGYDVVYAQRIVRQGESVFKKWSAWLFYRLMKTLVYKDLPPDVGDFRLVSRKCLDAISEMREMHRFLRGMVTWVGFPQIAVSFVRQPRAAGETKYPLVKMLRFAWTAAVSFSPLPLRLSFFAGAVLLTIGFMYAIYGLIELWIGVTLVPGWISLVVLNCLGSGAIMIAVGILGEYVARIFEEIKRRPLYLVSETHNLPPRTLPERTPPWSKGSRNFDEGSPERRMDPPGTSAAHRSR